MSENGVKLNKIKVRHGNLHRYFRYFWRVLVAPNSQWRPDLASLCGCLRRGPTPGSYSMFRDITGRSDSSNTGFLAQLSIAFAIHFSAQNFFPQLQNPEQIVCNDRTLKFGKSINF